MVLHAPEYSQGALAHRTVEAQGRFARRHGETIELPNETMDGFDRWNIAGVVRHDDHAPVVLRERNGTRTMTIPALHLDRFESAARGHAAPIGTAEVIAVDDIEGESDESELVDGVLQKLKRWERYAPAGVMASAFPREIGVALERM